MSVVVVTPPAPLVSLATAKAHLRVTGDHEDALIRAYVAAACAHIDGPGGWLGRAVGLQTLEYRPDWATCWAQRGTWNRLELPYPPIVQLVSFKYDDAAGDEQDLVLEDTVRLTALGEIELLDGQSWPTTRAGSDARRIQYEAGYEAVPAPIVAAVLLMTGDLYANRETGVVGTVSAEIKMSTTVENLLSPYRVWTV